MPATVSINLCCYNSEKYLRETLDSIINQTYKDWELIIINDGSTDHTEQIIFQYKERGFPIIYHFQKNHGLAYSRNEALNRSNGEYIAFIDHDDIWLPHKLEKQMKVFKNQPDIDFIYTNYYKMIMYSRNRLIIGLKGEQPEGHIFKDFIYNYNVFVSTVVLTKKSLYSLDHLFDEQLALMEEYDVFMRILYRHKAAYMDEVTAIYRFHNNMASIQSPKLVLNECPILIEKFKNMDQRFEELNPDIIKYMEIRWINYSKAKAGLIYGNDRDIRKYVSPHKWYSIKMFLIYLATFIPRRTFMFFYHHIFFKKGRI